MKYKIENNELTLESENETDKAIISSLWTYPLIVEYEHHPSRFGIYDNYAKLVSTRHVEKDV
jgi:hypothetical protein